MLFRRNAIADTLRKNFVSLESSLYPMRKISQFGLLLPWCSSTSNDGNRFLRAIRWICILINLSTTFFFAAFHSTQLIMAIDKDGTFHDLIPYLIWGIPVILAFLTQLEYLVHRNRYIAFFDDWKSLLEQNLLIMSETRPSNIRMTILFVYLSHAVILLWAVGDTIWLFFISDPKIPSAGLLLIDFPLLQNLFPDMMTLLPIFIVALSFALMSFAFVMDDIVPTFVYYHAAKAVDAMRNEIQRIYGQPTVKEEEIQRVTSIYNVLCRLVSRADDLFGRLIVLNHGVSFFLICAQLYTLFQYKAQMSHGELASIPVLTAIYVYRMTWTMMLTAQLHRSAGHLREDVASIVLDSGTGTCWQNGGLLNLFLSRLDHHLLAARPLGIYELTPSTMLSVSSLIVTYTIILHQSR